MLPLLGVAHMGVSPEAQDNTLQEAKTPKQQLNVTGPNRTTPMTTAYNEVAYDFTEDDLIIYNGHGQTWAELDFTASIDRNIPRSKWSTVQFMDYEHSLYPSGATFINYNVDFSQSEGKFHAHFVTRNLDAHGTIYLIYSYETNLYPTTAPKQGQQSFSYWFTELQKFDGHGQTWYELRREVSISGVAQENWGSVQYTGYTQSGNSNFFADDTFFDSSTGIFHVYLRTRNQYAFGSVTLKYSYDKQIHYPIVTAYGETAHQVKANEFEYFNGHGQTWYTYQKSFKIDLDPFFWDDVEIEEWGYTSGLQFFAGDVDFNANTGMINVNLRSHNAANGNLYILYNYQAEKVLKSISLSGNYKREFLTGETFTTSGLVVTAKYHCGVNNQTVTNYTYSANFNMNQPGSYYVRISYTENEITKTAGYYIVVRDPSLQSISLSGDFQTEFVAEDEFNADGLVVTAYYENGTSRAVEDYDIDLSDVDMEFPGDYEVVVTYTEGGITKSASYNITVAEREPELESIALFGNYQTTFQVGDTFNSNGLRVIAYYDDGHPVEVYDFSVDSSNVNMNAAGVYNVTVSFTDKGITKSSIYAVVVNEAQQQAVLMSISLSGSQQTVFQVGDEFNTDGLVVTALYDDGHTEDVTENAIIDASSVNMQKAGRYTVKVSFTDTGISKTQKYQIRVVA